MHAQWGTVGHTYLAIYARMLHTQELRGVVLAKVFRAHAVSLS